MKISINLLPLYKGRLMNEGKIHFNCTISPRDKYLLYHNTQECYQLAMNSPEGMVHVHRINHIVDAELIQIEKDDYSIADEKENILYVLYPENRRLNFPMRKTPKNIDENTPIMYLDVDDVLNYKRNLPDQLQTVKEEDIVCTMSNKTSLTWSPEIIERLNYLSENYIEIRWMSNWEHKARSIVAPTLNLNDFPVYKNFRKYHLAEKNFGRLQTFEDWWCVELPEEDINRPMIWISGEDRFLLGMIAMDHRWNNNTFMMGLKGRGIDRDYMNRLEQFLKSIMVLD